MSKINFGEALMNPDNASITPITPLSAAPDPAVATRLPVTLDQLVAYAGNPRTQQNPKYDEIKESIRNRGLDHPPSVTREGPDQPYMIRNGGNTRLQALKELWEETQDPRFFTIDCMFHPFKSEMDVLLAHVVENDVRGRMTFIDRARAAIRLRDFIQQEDEELTTRKLAERITGLGWPLAHQTLSSMLYAHSYLLPWLPQTLDSGMGRPAVMNTRKMLDVVATYWNKVAMPHNGDVSSLWQPVLVELDNDQAYSVDRALPIIEDAIAKALDFPVAIVRAEIQALQSGVTQPDDEIPRPAISNSDNAETAPINLWEKPKGAINTVPAGDAATASAPSREGAEVAPTGITHEAIAGGETEEKPLDTAENALRSVSGELSAHTPYPPIEIIHHDIKTLDIDGLKMNIYSAVANIFDAIGIDSEATVWFDANKPYGVWLESAPLRENNPVVLLAYQIVMDELATAELVGNPLDHIETMGDGWNSIVDAIKAIGQMDLYLFRRTADFIRNHPTAEKLNYNMISNAVMVEIADEAIAIRNNSAELAMRLLEPSL